MGVMVYRVVVKLRSNVVAQFEFPGFLVMGAKMRRPEPMGSVVVDPFEVQRRRDLEFQTCICHLFVGQVPVA